MEGVVGVEDNVDDKDGVNGNDDRDIVDATVDCHDCYVFHHYYSR